MGTEIARTDGATLLMKPEALETIGSINFNNIKPEEYQIVSVIAKAPAPVDPIATKDEILKILKYLSSTLGYRNIDDETGRMKVAVYVTVLNGLSLASLKFASHKILEEPERRFMPEPGYIKDIALGFSPAILQAHDRCKVLSKQYREQRFRDLHRKLMARELSQEQVDELSDRNKQIGEERGSLMLVDGRYLIRPMPDLERPLKDNEVGK